MTLLGKSLIVSHRQLNVCKAFILLIINAWSFHI